mgnify:CR=1 FL=1
MKVVGVCACTAGIAHTYMAREHILEAAKQRGDSCFIETQGTIGPEYVLTDEQIAELTSCCSQSTLPFPARSASRASYGSRGHREGDQGFPGHLGQDPGALG